MLSTIMEKKKTKKRPKSLKLQLGLGDLQNVAIIFVVLAVVLAVGSYILVTIGQQPGFNTANAVANETLQSGSAALHTFSTWLPILAIVIVAAIVIYILMGVFSGGHRAAA